MFVVIGVLQYLGPTDLTVYFVKNITMTSITTADGIQGIQTTIILGTVSEAFCINVVGEL